LSICTSLPLEKDIAAMQPPSDRSPGGADSNEVLTNLAGLVIGMSRLLVELSAMEPFKSAGFALTDWVALSVLAKGSARSNRELAKVLGVTRQRANQIKTSLEEMKFISSTQSNEDARENVLIVTEAGHILLADINARLLAIMSVSLKDKERLLARANRSVRVLHRAVRATRLRNTSKSHPAGPKEGGFTSRSASAGS
jgi:DNA-binding MarR family transcriptional regulator